MLEFHEVLKRRCSVRRFRPDPIAKETLLRVLQAGTLATSAGNRQPWEFFVLTDKDRQEQIGEIKRRANEELFKRKGFKDQREALVSAPVVLAVCYKKTKTIFSGYRDMGDITNYISAWLSTENIVLAANAEGLGALTMMPFYEEEMKKVLGIPEDYGIASIVPLGSPWEEPRHKSKVPVEEKMHLNKW